MQYRILRRLAVGGFSEVFEVHDLGSALDEVLVLKRLHPEMSSRPEVRSAFAQEARILRSLSHPDVVSFRRCFFDDAGRICLLMEHAEGAMLSDWSQRNGDDAEASLQLFDRILGAVDYLHHRPHPLLHLDLKPDNILVRESSRGPRPTLIDFGIARGLGTRGLKAFSEPYSAPEQRSGRELGCSTDVHALGHIFAEMLEPLADSMDEGLFTALRRVADKARRQAPHRRFVDAAQMRSAVRDAKALRVDPGPGKALKPRFPKFNQWSIRTVGLTVVFAALIGSLVAFERTDDSPPQVSAAADIERFHQALEDALQSTHHAAVERHFEEARRALDGATVTPETRRILQAAFSEVRRVVNLPVLTPADRDAATRELYEQVSSASSREVSP